MDIPQVPMKFRASILAAAVGAFCGGHSASAKIIEVKLTGQVVLATGVAAPEFSRGEDASAILRYNTNASGYYLYGKTEYEYYPAAGLGGVLQIGSYQVSIPNFYVMVTNDEASRFDRFIVISYSGSGSALGGKKLNDLFFNWQAAASYRNGNAMPDTAAELYGYGMPVAVIDYGPAQNSKNRVQVSFSRVTTTAVPEPTGWALMITGFGAVGAVGRRRFRRESAAIPG